MSVSELSKNQQNSTCIKTVLLAECLGTLLLLAIVVGSGIMAQNLSTQNTGVALLANAVATGAGLYVLINQFAQLSGAHFNPIVSIYMVYSEQLTIQRAIGYIGAQIVGAMLGIVLAHAMFDLPLLQYSNHYRTGTGQWISEIVATSGLILTIVLLSRFKPQQVASGVALYITSAYWFTASTSFANPAVTIARGLTNTFAGIYPPHILGFIVAQCIGLILAIVLLSILLPKNVKYQ